MSHSVRGGSGDHAQDAHTSLDDVLQRLDRLGVKAHGTDEEYSFVAAPPPLISTSSTLVGEFGFGDGMDASATGPLSGEYFLHSTPLRAGASGGVSRLGGFGTRTPNRGISPTLSTHSSGSMVSTRRAASPFTAPPGSSLFPVTSFADPGAFCCGLIGSGTSKLRFCTAGRAYPHNHCGTRAHGTSKFPAARDTYYCPTGHLRGQPTASTVLSIPIHEVHSSLRQQMEVGRFTVEKWKDLFLDAEARRMLVSPHHMLGNMTPATLERSARRRVDMSGYDDMSTLESDDGMEDGVFTREGAIPPRISFSWEPPHQEGIPEPPSPQLLAFDLLRTAIEQCFIDQQHYEEAVVSRVDSAVANQLGELQVFIARYGSVSRAFQAMHNDGNSMLSQEVLRVQQDLSRMSDDISRLTSNGSVVSKEEFLRVVKTIVTTTERLQSSSSQAASSARTCVRQVQQLLQAVPPPHLPPGAPPPPSGHTTLLDGDTTVTVKVHGGSPVPVTFTLLYNRVVDLERTVKLLNDRSQGSGTSFGRWSYAGEKEFGSWRFRLDPSGLGMAAFVDAVSIWKFGNVVGQDAAEYLNEAHKAKNIGFKQGEADHVTSYGHRCPSAFVGSGDGSTVLSTTIIKMFEKWENWKGNGTGDGVKERLTQAMNLAVERHEVYVQSSGLPAELKEMALKTAELTRAFWLALTTYIDDEYMMLISFKLSPKHVLLLLSNQVVQICDDMFAHRSRGANVDLQDRAAGITRLAWCTLQAHSVMSSYVAQKFRNHPSISGTFVRFLTRHMTDAAPSGCEDLVKRIKNVEDDLATLKRELAKGVSQADFDTFKKRVEKFMEKPGGNRNA